MDTYKGFTLINDNHGYYIYNRDVECGFYHIYSDALSAIDRFYRLLEV